MNRFLLTILFFSIGAIAALAQTPMSFWHSPEKVVEHVWEMAVTGDLLTAEGWDRASGYYTKPNPPVLDKSFDVYSNYYGLDSVSIKGDKAEVVMDFDNAGRIDSNLHYSPPPRTNAFKTGLVFRLSLTPSYMQMFGPDGKTLVERKPTGDSAWKIDEQAYRPWTTVNTAIRYVLEMRTKTTDPVIKKNADETIAKLLTLH